MSDLPVLSEADLERINDDIIHRYCASVEAGHDLPPLAENDTVRLVAEVRRLNKWADSFSDISEEKS